MNKEQGMMNDEVLDRTAFYFSGSLFRQVQMFNFQCSMLNTQFSMLSDDY